MTLCQMRNKAFTAHLHPDPDIWELRLVSTKFCFVSVIPDIRPLIFNTRRETDFLFLHAHGALSRQNRTRVCEKDALPSFILLKDVWMTTRALYMLHSHS